MDFLNQSFAQFKELFDSMTPAARITTGLLLAVVVISMTYLVKNGGTGPSVPLFGETSLASADVSAIKVAIGVAGLNDYELKGNDFYVPRSKRAEYMAAVATGKALPQNFDDILDESLESNSIFPTRKMTEQQMKVAKLKLVRSMLEDLPAVQTAKVNYDETKTGSFKKTITATAIVTARGKGGEQLSPEVVKALKHIVSAGYASLTDRGVTVVDSGAGITYASSSETGPGAGEDNIILQRKKEFQEDYRQRLLNGPLAHIRGVWAQVEVEIDPIKATRQIESKYDPKAVNLSMTETTSSTDTTRSVFGNRPGVAGQTPANTGRSIASTDVEKDSTKDESIVTTSVPSRTVTQTDTVGLMPTDVRASIGIPRRHIIDLWRQSELQQDPAFDVTSVPPDAVQKQLETKFQTEMQEHSVLLQAVKAGDSVFPKFHVSFFGIVPPAPLPEPSMATGVTDWLAANWSTLGTTLVGMFSLLMLRSMVQSPGASPTSPAEGEAASLSIAAEEDEDADDSEDGPTRRFSVNGPNLRDEVADLVREDLDASANILKAWIGDAA